MKLTADEQITRGNQLAEVLQLHPSSKGFYQTAWGKKTAKGLYCTIAVLMGLEDDLTA